jgi:hypothetical protein
VRRALEARGVEVVVFSIDRVLSGAERFTVHLKAEGVPELNYNGVPIAPDDIAAAWYWKPTSFRTPGAESNVAKQLSLVNEITQLNNSLWGLYPAELWLNSPAATWVANQKLPQLLLARDVGFDIPATLVSNEWDDVTASFFGVGVDEVIAKMHRGVIADGNKIKAMYSTVLDADAAKLLATGASPFPAMIQPLLAKAREWRVTVVGAQVFPAAIHTSAAARDDWRRLQLDPAHVEFRTADLPDKVSERCIEFLTRAGLGYGAFDLVETPADQVVFLECNPSGQFMWLVEQLGLPIPGAIADALLAVAATASADTSIHRCGTTRKE